MANTKQHQGHPLGWFCLGPYGATLALAVR